MLNMTSKKTKHLLVCLTRMLLVTELLLLSGCATMGAKMALSIAKEEEAKGCEASYPGDGIAKVALEDCLRVSRLIKKAGVLEGFVGYDRNGGIKLKGSYINEDQVDRAYMVALTVVGVSSLDISPVTPRDLQEIKMVKSFTPQQDSNRTSNKYALLIGVSEFKNRIKPIGTAKKDVEELKKILIKTGFSEKNIVTLTDEQATKNAILAAIRELEGKVSPNDTVVFYISTHGTPPDTFGKMGVIPYDMDLVSRETENWQAEASKISKNESGDAEIIEIVNQRLRALKSAISFSDLQDFVTNIRSNNFVAILDTCYSGSALGALTYPVGGNQYTKREMNFVQSSSANSKSEMLGDGQLCAIDDKSSYGNAMSHGIPSVQKSGYQVTSNAGSKGLETREEIDSNISQEQKEAISQEQKKANEKKYQYSDLEKFRRAFGFPIQKGKAILTATSNNEESLFDPSIFDNSYFTYYLIEGLKRSKGEILPAFDYAQIRTRKLVSDTKKYETQTQTPEMVSAPAACTNIDLSY